MRRTASATGEESETVIYRSAALCLSRLNGMDGEFSVYQILGNHFPVLSL